MDLINKISIHPDFYKTVDELRDKNIFFGNHTSSTGSMFSEIYAGGYKLKRLEEIGFRNLNLSNGEELSKKVLLAGYDETINKYRSLEGTSVLVVYVLTYLGGIDYYPTALVTLNFYTSAKDIIKNSTTLRYAEKIESVINKDIAENKTEFICDTVQPFTVLLIDGPLIAGDYYTTMLDKIKTLHEQDILPVFIVKNSESTLVIDNIPGLRNKYNSDLHWAHRTLKPGQRSGLFLYSLEAGSTRNKAFCYFKSYDETPIRIEFHGSTIEKYSSQIDPVLDIIHYQIQLHGSLSNPQPRIIAIAEKYAREIAAYINFNELTKFSYITPIFNQIRFGS
ncbi:hypothetical protein MASR2M41_26310 [Flammeovirgaceae bacterium]